MIPAPTPRRQKILIVGPSALSLTNFFGSLIRTLSAAGNHVVAASGDHQDSVVDALTQWGAEYRTVSLARTGMNPLSDAATIRSLVRLMRDVRPDVFFGYAMKPSLYGLLAARLAGVERRIAVITGLGYAFTEGDEPKRRAARVAASAVCRLALPSADRVVFLNPDDQAVFVGRGFVKADRAALINGSGVDIARFSPVPAPSGPVTFLLIARLLRDKGIYEFIEAARMVRAVDPTVRFRVVGGLDANPTSISRTEVDAWVAEGLIEWAGEVPDVRPHIAACHALILPSYREGVPQSVLEAMSMARAVIVTDVPGCRETVIPGQNGIMVPPRDARALSEAILHLASDPALMEKMGREGRRIAETRFASEIVNAQLLDLIHEQHKEPGAADARKP